MRRILIIVLALATLLCAAACTRMDEQKTKLRIFIRFPEQSLTKAGPGTTTATTLEQGIHDLRIWVFLAEPAGKLPAGQLVGYLQPTAEQYTIDGVTPQSFDIDLEKSLARDISRVDVYILANAASLGLDGNTLNINTTRDALNDLVLEGAVFGMKADATDPSKMIPSNGELKATDKGLPYSAFGKNILVSDDYPEALYLPTMELVRAVSKVRIVVSQVMEESGNKPMNFSITGLQLNDNLVPTKEYLFNRTDNPYTPYSIDGTFIANPLDFITTTKTQADIAGCTTPSKYAYKSQSIQDYETLITSGITSGELTSLGFCYLRESSKGLTGHIDYQIGSTSNSCVFEMENGENFARNCSWIVYIYFFDDTMRFTVTPATWVAGDKIPLT